MLLTEVTLGIHCARKEDEVEIAWLRLDASTLLKVKWPGGGRGMVKKWYTMVHNRASVFRLVPVVFENLDGTCY